MSWTKRSQEVLYRDFTEKAAGESSEIAERPWSLEVWDISEDGQLREYVQNTARRLNGKPQLRIVFAPLDVPRRETKGLMIELFHKFGIPHEFTTERVRSTSHSFCRRSYGTKGFSSWFRLSCISVASAGIDTGNPEDDATEEVVAADKFLERESAFFLHASDDASVSLVCFGAGLRVKRRMHDLTKSRGWADVGVNPTILFDVILEGLHEEVDDTARRIEDAFAPLEQSIIRLAGSQCESSTLKVLFGELYSSSRHAAELSKAVESALLLNESILMSSSLSNTSGASSITQTPSSPSDANSNRRRLVGLQLRECLEYRRTLSRSAQLRLSHLQKRIEVVTALASNIVSQQQSAAVIQGPVSMKLIAASVLVFLPTITVATIAGSRLLLSEQLDEEGTWSVSATPLFYLLWYISIPLTLAVVILSLGWLWWRQGKSRKTRQSTSWFHSAMIWRSTKGRKGENEGLSLQV